MPMKVGTHAFPSPSKEIEVSVGSRRNPQIPRQAEELDFIAVRAKPDNYSEAR
jgi:hypothetical protein